MRMASTLAEGHEYLESKVSTVTASRINPLALCNQVITTFSDMDVHYVEHECTKVTTIITRAF